MSQPGEPFEVLNLQHLNGPALEQEPTQNLGIMDITFATANVLTLKAGIKEEPDWSTRHCPSTSGIQAIS